MSFKISSLVERLSTLLTSEWFLTSVDPLVRFKKTYSGKNLPTIVAAVESCVNKLVIFKTVPMGEALSTLLTSEWFLPCVDPLVRFKTSLIVKALPTLLTSEWFLPSVNSLMSLKNMEIGKSSYYTLCS